MNSGTGNDDPMEPENIFVPSRCPHHGKALVTGAGSGIGRAVASALCHAGYHVILVGRKSIPLNLLADQLGKDVTTVCPIDITDEDALPALIRNIESLDVLIHSAGMFHGGLISEISNDMNILLHHVNVDAPLYLSNLLLPALETAGGQVVFLNSTASLGERVSMDAYAASKHALKQGVSRFREESRGRGIRILNVYPGRTATPMQSEVLRHEGRSDMRIPLLQPKDIADVILGCLSVPRSAEITDIVIRPPDLPRD